MTYKLPDFNALLPTPPCQTQGYDDAFLKTQGTLIEHQLANFGVKGKITSIHPGPVITRYCLLPDTGVKASQITNLVDDLAMGLKAKSIRILAPIPGENAIGIELPNPKPQIVYIKELLNCPQFIPTADQINLAVGKDINGIPQFIDLTEAPHMLVAGQTGAGKSICVNSFIASILLTKTPDEVRLLLIDPKIVEFAPYKAIPHLLHPVINDPAVAVESLNWLTVEMDKRYETLSKLNARNIKTYNKISTERMPYIVVMIDELADLMMISGKEVEFSIIRLAQKARAVGIHLILTTQRPSVDVITGNIKNNMTTRIGFRTSSQVDSRIIIDSMGCEKLLGRGDMLYKSSTSPELQRLHGCFITDGETQAIIDYCVKQEKYPYLMGSQNKISNSDAEENDTVDIKFEESARLLFSVQRCSISYLQRKMGLDYNRCAKIIKIMKEKGIINLDGTFVTALELNKILVDLL